MRLTQLLIPAIISIATVNCQAESIQKPVDYIPSLISQPQQPKKQKKDYQNMKAIIEQKEDEIKKTKINYKI